MRGHTQWTKASSSRTPQGHLVDEGGVRSGVKGSYSQIVHDENSSTWGTSSMMALCPVPKGKAGRQFGSLQYSRASLIDLQVAVSSSAPDGLVGIGGVAQNPRHAGEVLTREAFAFFFLRSLLRSLNTLLAQPICGSACEEVDAHAVKMM
jgi:hypothetical protein